MVLPSANHAITSLTTQAEDFDAMAVTPVGGNVTSTDRLFVRLVGRSVCLLIRVSMKTQIALTQFYLNC